jgi:hypothetical protein
VVDSNPFFRNIKMIRSIVLAASAIALTIAAPASAAEMRVKVSGKSAAEVRAEIVKAASTVCWQDIRGEALAGYLYPACIRASVNDAVSKINNPALTAYNTANPASAAVLSR